MTKAIAATAFLATTLACLIVQTQDRTLNWRVNEPIPSVWEDSVDSARHAPGDKRFILGRDLCLSISELLLTRSQMEPLPTSTLFEV